MTFDAGETEETFTFSATNDAMDDDGERVRLSFGSSPPTGVTTAIPTQTTVHIIDDDTAGVTVNPTMLDIAEHATSSYTMVLDSQPTHEVTVTINSPAGTEILTLQPRLRFTTDNWDIEQSVTVIANPDRDTADDNGVITHSFDSLDDDYDRVTPSGVVVTVIDDDVPDVAVSFEEGTYSVAEGGTTTIKITLSADPERTVTIPITETEQGGATSADYSDVPSSLTFHPGETEKSFTFVAVQDSVDDDNELVKLTFGELPSQVTLGPTDEAVVAISDDDVPSVTLNFEQATYAVAEGGTTTIKVILSADPERTVNIPITATEQGGATSAEYSGVPADVTFQAGDTEKDFIFTAVQDSVDDDGESVKLTFGTLPSQVTSGPTDEATVTIADDDVPGVTVSFEQATYAVAEGGTTTIVITLSANPERAINIPVTATNQGGATSADYSGVPAEVTFQAGDTEKGFTFTAVQDSVDDDEESVKLAFGTLPSHVTSGPTDEATVTISDDDVPGVTVSFDHSAYVVSEGSTTTVKITLSADPERTVNIPITATDQGGATSADYSGVPASVTLNSGDTVQEFTFMAVRDNLDDDGELVRLTFGELPSQVTSGPTDEATVTIADDDVPRVAVSFEHAAYSVDEGNTTTIKVILSADPERTITIPITATEQGGGTSADYSGVPTSMTFDSGETEHSFIFTAIQDSVDDDGESLKLTFGELPSQVTSGPTDEATVTIADDDVPRVAVSFEHAAYSVDEGNTTTIKVILSADPERTITIPITATEQGGATSADYSGVPTSVTFDAGETEEAFAFVAVQDNVNDDGESVKLTLGTLPSYVTSVPADEATVTISDDDIPMVSISFDQTTYVVSESSTTTVKITLSADPERTVTVPITSTEQGGASSADYSGVPASVTFDIGETEKAFTFFATHDAMDDDGERIRLSFGFSLPTGVTAAIPTQTTVQITDDDTAGVTVNPTMLEIAEHATSSYTVVLDSQPTHEVTVTINSPAGTEILTIQPRLTFTTENWDIEQSVTVIANPDRDTSDDNGLITHTVDSLDDDYGGVTPSGVAVTVIDDDVPGVTVSFVQETYTVAEGGTTSIKVTLNTDPERIVTIPITRTEQGGATNADYTGVPASLTFYSGETELSFTFTAVQDSVDDDGESVRLTFGMLPSQVTAGPTDEATVTISDDDVPSVTVSFEQAAYAVAEGSTTTIKVILSADPERTLTIPIRKTEQGGATSADYSGVPINSTSQPLSPPFPAYLSLSQQSFHS